MPGKLEWDDLIEAFDKYEVTEDSEGNEVLEAVESWDSSEHRVGVDRPVWGRFRTEQSAGGGLWDLER